MTVRFHGIFSSIVYQGLLELQSSIRAQNLMGVGYTGRKMAPGVRVYNEYDVRCCADFVSSGYIYNQRMRAKL